ncbi:Ribosomal RNA small subunit methyltransferase I [Propionispora sp. 2/2-37]|uniref:16S rRNA (cytidine(1402)-2'-O)-methyltransferase n=1 Tax=Propionispora sp. 2/2-37 TaxID=1677858 RepID=UPI0006BB7DEF|nr:16S rRNA (cytidine(1402)-2'-O)-methyltransferase [Propionispora sp. 2/2-37]CUH95447.1 Ribosomal RNA small subunit methyltransferase I [Propionispora sp. 2/2-37]
MGQKPGTVYLCATPIGNLEDMTFRAVRILKEAAVIAAEDTRHTRRLLSHFDIHTPLVSYHEHNKLNRGPELITRLLRGDDVAVVSDAGMPGISDPGVDLVKLAVAASIPVVPVPGANAALSGLVCSGIDATIFSFLGFLPKTKKKRHDLITAWSNHRHTLVLYETPYRLQETLAELQECWGDRRAVAARELTKKYEEFIRGSLSSLQEHFTQNPPRGEFTLIITGQQENVPVMQNSNDVSVYQLVMQSIDNGDNKKDAIRKVASELGLPKREVYQAVVGHEAGQPED